MIVYSEQTERYGKFFGLKLSGSGQAATTNIRPGMSQIQCGFPVRYLKDFKEKARHAGLTYVVVAERGYYPSGLKQRVATEIFRGNGRYL
jgi:hypothetical protein